MNGSDGVPGVPGGRHVRVPLVHADDAADHLDDDRIGVRRTGLAAARWEAADGGGEPHRVSDVVRLTFVSHGMTDAIAAGRFPIDEPLNNLGQRQLDATVELGSSTPRYADRRSEPADRGTARGTRRDRRRTCRSRLRHVARQCARRGATCRTGDLVTDQTATPHGGESVVGLIVRVRRWLDSLGTRRGRIVAVTHPAVIRASVLIALDAPPKSFWRIDVSPASRTVMHLRGHAWTLLLDGVTRTGVSGRAAGRTRALSTAATRRRSGCGSLASSTGS